MPFQPESGQELTIDGVAYRVAEHPNAPGMPYGQEGRAAVVYQLVAEAERRALKVFKPRYRLPEMVSVADGIAPHARLPGLRVCQRAVLTPQRHATLLRQHPDLTYAVLMPWVEGPTWMEVLMEKRPLPPEQSLSLARSLARVLAGMEQRRLAHCDLSGPNLLLPALVPAEREEWEPLLELVDVEQLYGPGLARPELTPGGSPGYAHKTAPDGMWGSTADRFSGAVLLGEMLCWCDDRMRDMAWGENYFDPREMQRPSDRSRTLATVLEERWGGGVAQLFQRIWASETLADCPTFGEWLVMMPEKVPQPAEATEVVPPTVLLSDSVQALLALARRFEEQGNYSSALQTVQQALTLVPPDSGLDAEIEFLIEDLEAKQKAAQPSQPQPAPPATLPETELVSPPSPMPQPSLDDLELDGLFEDGLDAYVDGRFAEAKELLAEVVRRKPDYQRSGQRADEMLGAAEKQLVSPGRRLLKGALRAVVGGLAVLVVFLVALAVLHLTLLRPAVEESLYDVVRPALASMVDVKPPRGGHECDSLSDKGMNDKLSDALGDTARTANVGVEFWGDTLSASAEIGGQLVEVEVEPARTEDGYLELLDLRTSGLLRLIVSQGGLQEFVEEFVNQDILDAGNMRISEFELVEDKLSICVVDRADFRPGE
jgi:tetratricopeptide (TPR) repeat protein